MIGAAYTKADGTVHELTQDDFMVVAPYNAQVRCVRTELDRAD